MYNIQLNKIAPGLGCGPARGLEFASDQAFGSAVADGSFQQIMGRNVVLEMWRDHWIDKTMVGLVKKTSEALDSDTHLMV